MREQGTFYDGFESISPSYFLHQQDSVGPFSISSRRRFSAFSHGPFHVQIPAPLLTHFISRAGFLSQVAKEPGEDGFYMQVISSGVCVCVCVGWTNNLVCCAVRRDPRSCASYQRISPYPYAALSNRESLCGDTPYGSSPADGLTHLSLSLSVISTPLIHPPAQTTYVHCGLGGPARPSVFLSVYLSVCLHSARAQLGSKTLSSPESPHTHAGPV